MYEQSDLGEYFVKRIIINESDKISWNGNSCVEHLLVSIGDRTTTITVSRMSIDWCDSAECWRSSVPTINITNSFIKSNAQRHHRFKIRFRRQRMTHNWMRSQLSRCTWHQTKYQFVFHFVSFCNYCFLLCYSNSISIAFAQSLDKNGTTTYERHCRFAPENIVSPASSKKRTKRHTENERKEKQTENNGQKIESN